jgi:hypothetical protein
MNMTCPSKVCASPSTTDDANQNRLSQAPFTSTLFTIQRLLVMNQYACRRRCSKQGQATPRQCQFILAPTLQLAFVDGPRHQGCQSRM